MNNYFYHGIECYIGAIGSAAQIVVKILEEGIDNADSGDREEIEEVTDFKALPGNGLTAVWEEKVLFGGNYKFICEKAEVSSKQKSIDVES